MTEIQKIDDEIRNVLGDAKAPMLADEIADEVNQNHPCDPDRVKRRIRELPEVEEGGHLYRLAGEDV